MDQRSENTSALPSTERPMREGARAAGRYVALLAAIVGLIFAASCLSIMVQDGDHFTAISRPGNASWYQDLAGNYVTEIHDQDLFFHDIGRSLDYARRADIIILGSSLVSSARRSSGSGLKRRME